MQEDHFAPRRSDYSTDTKCSVDSSAATCSSIVSTGSGILARDNLARPSRGAGAASLTSPPPLLRPTTTRGERPVPETHSRSQHDPSPHFLNTASHKQGSITSLDASRKSGLQTPNTLEDSTGVEDDLVERIRLKELEDDNLVQKKAAAPAAVPKRDDTVLPVPTSRISFQSTATDQTPPMLPGGLQRAANVNPGIRATGAYSVQPSGAIQFQRKGTLSGHPEEHSSRTFARVTPSGELVVSTLRQIFNFNSSRRNQGNVLQAQVQAASLPSSTPNGRNEDGNQKRNNRRKLYFFMLFVLLTAVVLIVVLISKNNENRTIGQGRSSSKHFSETYKKLREHLKDLSKDVLDDLESPQAKALDWFANHDVEVANHLLGMDDIKRIKSRYSLATLYFATTESPWWNQTEFLSPDDECNWYGIECDETNNHVRCIRLPSYGLHGTLPRELQALTNLTHVEFFDNKLTGSIPFQSLRNLAYLDVRSNELTGPLIPRSEVELDYMARKMTTLILSDNKFASLAPTTIPSSVARLTALTELYLSACNLTGTIPDKIGDLSDSLNVLDIAGNRLTGTLPASMTLLSNLRSLQLHQNNFNGTIPQALGQNLTSLSFLIGGSNAFTGTFPWNSFVSERSYPLQHIVFDNNILTGPALPTDIGLRFPSMLKLVLNNNECTGTIPSSLAALKNTEIINLAQNKINGTLPGIAFETDGLALLTTFDISHNSLHGTLPTELGNLLNLEYLNLQHNRLTGTIPDLGHLPNLTKLDISFNNGLSGTIPETICNISNETLVVVTGCVSDGEAGVGLVCECNKCFFCNDKHSS